MKILKHLSTMLLLLCFVACSNKFSLQKRKYRKGFFFEVVSNKSSKTSGHQNSIGNKNIKTIQFTNVIQPDNTIQILDSLKTKNSESKLVNFTTKANIDPETKVLLNQDKHSSSQPNFFGQKKEMELKKSTVPTFFEAIGNFLYA